MLPRVRLDRNRVVMNLVRLLAALLDPRIRGLATGDFAVRVGEQSVRCPGVTVLPTGRPGSSRCVGDPATIVEGLSTPTLHRDFGRTLVEDQAIDSLDTCLIVATDRRMIWQWSRDAERTWPSETVHIVEGSVPVPVLDVVLPINEIYRGVDVPPGERDPV